MSYQNPTQECYGDNGTPSQPQPLNNPNVGISNSSRGHGTTLSEITSKLRFLNCAASLFIVVFHTLPRVMNPIKLAVLLSHPMQLILEIVLGYCALILFVCEARIPLLGRHVLEVNRRYFRIDFDTARGRVLVLIIMTGTYAMVQYLMFHHGSYSSDTLSVHGGTNADPPSMINSTSFDNISISNATSSNGTIHMSTPESHNTVRHKTNFIPLTIVLSAIVSPTMPLIIYTLYIMQIYPDYVCLRAYPESSEATSSTFQSVNTRNIGYQNLNPPSWAQPVV